MIIRIFGEGQYELPETALPRLHELDADAHSALESGDPERFHDHYGRLLDYIRSNAGRLAADDLRPSDLMLPPPDSSLAEAAREFHGHGLLPE